MNSQKKKGFGIRFFSRAFYGVCLAVFLLFLVEGLFFAWILNAKNDTARSDAVLVFMGTEKRIETAYQLANQGIAPYLILSPSCKRLRNLWDKRYSLKTGITHIPEIHGSTTFENAFYTSRIIETNQFKTVTLVTSDYHMPRSLMLLRLFLAGTDVRVKIHKVTSFHQTGDPPLAHFLYNEFLEFWGSLFEFTSWKITGKLPEKPEGQSQISRFLKSLLLLNIKLSW
ncbi:MAG: YdcF family protein [Desulfobacteraceae bacterium]|nr:MAG: YdcF family protein [Desulfobacteraceae bacterium]